MVNTRSNANRGRLFAIIHGGAQGSKPTYRNRRNDLSNQVRFLRNKLDKVIADHTKLSKMYTSLQEDYKTMRNNHVSMAVINKRLQGDAATNEKLVAKLAASKCVLENSLEQLEKSSATLEEKTHMLASKIDDLEAQLKKAYDLDSIKVEASDVKPNKLDLDGYQLSKDARIRAIKHAIDEVKLQLGPWGEFSLEDEKIDDLFKDINQLL